ncbi:helix-turn-helix transcriptional regulator [Gymnodinialimonas ceratoperidinii]|uniref:Shikimate kinase n=1 Tax=Gymnodinialimonas ceratoperidinii TaxID=2856823 RepID=A0A8F6YBI9_9RHOB|nr:helix-turn-helix transcriptional regulator [Gymnodinialimonas ceratoperidinii]QXT38227.1 helix-turn-helix transcriptional regulator [Gymnodinialimonas ceratoperidinii]
MPDDARHIPFEEDVAELIHHVGEKVLSLRKARRMSRRELSETSGVSPRYLAKLEGGDGNISIGLLKRVALALDTPVEQILVRDDPQAAETLHMMQMYRRADAGTRARVLQVLDPERTRAQKAERLCLVGLRGAGKSTLGARISAAFDAPFIELNDEIEQNAGMPVAEIIALYGQEGYRQLEADTLGAIVKSHERAIVAVAGGIVSEETTFQQLLSRFHSVWVRTSPGEHMERVRAQGDVRPMEGNPQAMIQLRQILKAREVYYAQADHLLDTSGKSVDVSEAELSDLIQTYQILGADRR